MTRPANASGALKQQLGRADRLRRKADFEKVYSKGRRVPGRFFIGYFLFRERGALRVGVVASRRVGDAIRRNRAKRRLREVFRKNKPPGSIAADVVLIARGAIIEASFEEIDRAYVRGVGRALEESRRKPEGA